jgi:hypothetical protein
MLGEEMSTVIGDFVVRVPCYTFWSFINNIDVSYYYEGYAQFKTEEV